MKLFDKGKDVISKGYYTVDTEWIYEWMTERGSKWIQRGYMSGREEGGSVAKRGSQSPYQPIQNE